MIHSIAPSDLSALLASSRRFALIDVRDESAFSRAHLFKASSIPLSRLELEAPSRMAFEYLPIVVYDADGSSESGVAVRRLDRYGYRNVKLLSDGLTGWQRAGFATYTGMHTPSKAFGELVEARLATPSIKPEVLAAMKRDGHPHVLIDCRPYSEYRNGSLPDSINVPGVELTYRVAEIVRDSKLPLIVHCAGRTRSIMAAQSLREWGAPNPVYALENGTMGWMLAGREIVRPDRPEAVFSRPPREAQALRELAAERRTAGAIHAESRESVEAAWHARDALGTCLIDVRSATEYMNGHDPRAIHAPGGQVLQATDRYLVVQNAKVIVCDDDGFRATVVATWLRRMGWLDVSVWPMHEEDGRFATGPESMVYLMSSVSGLEEIDPEQLQSVLLTDAVEILDLDSSVEFERSHLPGAKFVRRDRVEEAICSAGDRRIILTSSDGRLARVVAAERATPGVSVLAGGKQRWASLGLPMTAGADAASSQADDVWRRPVEAAGDLVTNMKAYLSWETGLQQQIARDPLVRFNF